MRKFLNTLFVLSEDSYLALDGETAEVLSGEGRRGQFPLHTLENILRFSYKGASPALMGKCAREGIDLCFLTPRGRVPGQGLRGEPRQRSAAPCPVSRGGRRGA